MDKDEFYPTLAREQASQEARIFRGFCSPAGPVVRTAFSGMASMLLLGGEGDW